MESVIDSAGQPWLIGENQKGERVLLEGAGLRQKLAAHTDSCSLMLTPDQPTALHVHLSNQKPNTPFYVSAWKTGAHAEIVVEAPTQPAWQYKLSAFTGKEEGAWKEIGGYVCLPPHLEGKTVHVYLNNPGKDTLLLDDFTLEQVPHIVYPEFDNPIKLTLDESSISHIQDQRKRSYQAGVIQSGKADLLPARLQSNGQAKQVQVRLKGDWLDHIENDKWSFRVIDTLSGEAYSLQDPATRHYMDEWVLHKLMEAEGILAPTYEFVALELNGRSLGVYAKEEHFTPHFLEQRGLPPGPFLRFKEDHKWAFTSWEVQEGVEKSHEIRLPMFQSTYPDVYDGKSWKTNEERYALMSEAWHALRALQSGVDPEATKYIDKGKFARFFALCDIAKGWHGLTWHNLRFWFNPETRLLEPVAFDHFSETGAEAFIFKEFVGQRRKIDQAVYFARDYLLLQFFNDDEFTHLYFEALDKYCDFEWWDKNLEAMQQDFMEYKLLDQQYYTDHFMNIDEHAVRCGDLRELKEAQSYGTIRGDYFRRAMFKWPGDTCLREEPFENMGIQAWRSKGKVELINFHCVDLRALGWSASKTDSFTRFENYRVVLPFLSNLRASRYFEEVPETAKYIWFETIRQKTRQIVKIRDIPPLPASFHPEH